jgi:hypothetical protein
MPHANPAAPKFIPEHSQVSYFPVRPSFLFANIPSRCHIRRAGRPERCENWKYFLLSF